MNFNFIKREGKKEKKTKTSWASWKRYQPRDAGDAASLSRVDAGTGCRSALTRGCWPGGEQPAAPCDARAAVWWRGRPSPERQGGSTPALGYHLDLLGPACGWTCSGPTGRQHLHAEFLSSKSITIISGAL